jgi:hypothetical protein
LIKGRKTLSTQPIPCQLLLSTLQSISLHLPTSSFHFIIDSIPIPPSIPFASSFPSFYLDLTQFSTPSDSISDSISRPQGLPQDLFQEFLQNIVCDSTPDYSNSSSIPQHLICSSDKFLLPIYITNIPNRILSEPITTYIAAKKKYKPVHLKVKPVIGELPDKFRIIRNIISNPSKTYRFYLWTLRNSNQQAIIQKSAKTNSTPSTTAFFGHLKDTSYITS